MKRVTARIGVAVLGVFLVMCLMLCAGIAYGDTGDTGLEEDTGHLVTYYRGAGCVRGEDVETGCANAAGGAGALFLVVIAAFRRK